MTDAFEGYTEDIAEAFDDAREEIAPGARLFLLRAKPETSQGLEPIPVGALTNGEVVSGWLPNQPRSRGRLILQICELGDVVRSVLEQAWGFAILLPGDAVATVYENGNDPEVPEVPTIRRWTFDATYTKQPWTVALGARLLEDGNARLLEDGNPRYLEAA